MKKILLALLPLCLISCDMKELGIDVPKPAPDLERQEVRIHASGTRGVGEGKTCISIAVDVNVLGEHPMGFSSPTLLSGQEWSRTLTLDETRGNERVEVKVTCTVLESDGDGFSVTEHALQKSKTPLTLKITGPDGPVQDLVTRKEYKTPVPRVVPPDTL